MAEQLTLGQRIKTRRKEIGLTQQELADMVGFVSKTAIAKIEADERGIHRSKINAFANALNVDVAFLLDDNFEIKKSDYDQVILISANGNKISYILTPKQSLEIRELLHKFSLDSFNGIFDDSKPSFEDMIFGTKNASIEVKMNKLYNLLIMMDWDNVPEDIEPLIEQYCSFTNTTRKKLMEDAKKYKKDRERKGLPYPF